MAEWRKRIDVSVTFNDDDLDIKEKAASIAAQLTNSGWLNLRDEEDDRDNLVWLFEELGDSEDEREFDAVWNAIYDEADADRVWLNVWPSLAKAPTSGL